MILPKLIQHADDPEWWIDSMFTLSDTRPPVEVTVTSRGESPNEQYRRKIVEILSAVDALVLLAAELILENYSYSHFKRLGIDESLLVKQETPETIADVVKLESVWFNDPEGESYEMSFSTPWDENHSYDIEFDDGEPTCCAVNG